jgi:hypothetical protein
MHVRLLFLLVALFVIAAGSSNALSQSSTSAGTFTLQVASFPTKELADQFVIHLVNAGEHPICSTVELQGRGYWTRVFVGLFTTSESARRYGERLIAGGQVTEFLVRRADLSQQATRPRRVVEGEKEPAAKNIAVTRSAAILRNSWRSNGKVSAQCAGATESISGEFTEEERVDCPEPALPILTNNGFDYAPTLDISRVPRPDPVKLAITLVTGGSADSSANRRQGGLWLTGDTAEGMARLRWMVGEENEHLIRIDLDGRVWIDNEGLARAAGLEDARVEDPLRAAGYISSNEGLLLIAQLSQGNHRYRLHIGAQLPTLGKPLNISGSVNLDNNFDSRINPYRRYGKKLENERPPEGFDSLVGLNPVARWYNLTTKEWVPSGEIAFHELAEAHAKVELGLDYLLQGVRPGAHAVALERERLLKTQRPRDDIVMTAGSNRVLRSQEEIRLFFADNPGGISQR